MTTKTGTGLIAAGVFFVFVGLCFLPAAFGRDPDRTLLAGGAVVIASGILAMAGGVYVKARMLGPTAPAEAQASTKRARSKSICDQCAHEEPVIQCRVHQLHLCADCLGKHYDFRSCAYVPSTRRAVPRSNTAAYSQTSVG
jgi:hypothetical protein